MGTGGFGRDVDKNFVDLVLQHDLSVGEVAGLLEVPLVVLRRLLERKPRLLVVLEVGIGVLVLRGEARLLPPRVRHLLVVHARIVAAF